MFKRMIALTLAIGFVFLTVLMAALYVEASERGKKKISMACGFIASISIIFFLGKMMVNMSGIGAVGSCSKFGTMELYLVNRRGTLPQEIIVHEGAHYIFPNDGFFCYEDKRLHAVIHAMGLLRCLELNRGDEVNEYAKYPETEKYAQLSRKAFELGKSLNNPQAAWDFLRLIAEGKTEEEAERIVRG